MAAPSEEFRVRVHLSLAGKRGERLVELKEILGFNSDGECAQYLLSKGMEACAMQVVQRDQVKRLYADIAASMPDMQQMFEGLDALPAPKKGKR